MFENYYRRLRFSSKKADRSLITFMEINESNRNTVLSVMEDKSVCCHKGCNLCCHALTLTVDPLNTCILLRVFSTIPYDELFPYFKACIDKRQKARDYIDSLPVDNDRNDCLEFYNKFGFTSSSCPFVDNQNGCLIYEFRPRICFSYFSSVPCKISFKPELSEAQKKRLEVLKAKAEIVEFSGLENDNGNIKLAGDLLYFLPISFLISSRRKTLNRFKYSLIVYKNNLSVFKFIFFSNFLCF